MMSSVLWEGTGQQHVREHSFYTNMTEVQEISMGQIPQGDICWKILRDL